MTHSEQDQKNMVDTANKIKRNYFSTNKLLKALFPEEFSRINNTSEVILHQIKILKQNGINSEKLHSTINRMLQSLEMSPLSETGLALLKSNGTTHDRNRDIVISASLNSLLPEPIYSPFKKIRPADHYKVPEDNEILFEKLPESRIYDEAREREKLQQEYWSQHPLYEWILEYIGDYNYLKILAAYIDEVRKKKGLISFSDYHQVFVKEWKNMTQFIRDNDTRRIVKTRPAVEEDAFVSYFVGFLHETHNAISTAFWMTLILAIDPEPKHLELPTKWSRK